MKATFRTLCFVLFAGIFLFSSCGGGEDQEDEKTSDVKTTRKRPQRVRPPEMPDSLKWHVSMTARTVPENRIKNARRNEDVPPVKLKDLFEKAAGFLPLVKPISPNDSVVKFLGFDLHYFVPSMELFDDPQSYALYRKGDDGVPAAIAIYDSVGPNNAEVFPFYYQNMVVYFFHYFGKDVSHQERKVIPGFFCNDFDGEGAVYFQPHKSQDRMQTLEDCGAVMLLTKELQPDRKITLDHLQVLTRSKIKYRDTVEVEELYDLHFGRRCDREYIDEEMVYQDLIDYIDDNRCGGGKVKILPRMGNQVWPLWVAGPEYAYEVLEEARPERVNKRDSASTWLVGGSGTNWRTVSREVPEVKLSAVLKWASANAKKTKRPAAGSRFRLGSGWDLRKMCVDTDKPGKNPRFCHYHEREDGSPDFISLVDSSGHGVTNLEVFPFYEKGAVVYFVDHFGKDHLHENAQRVPGFFVYWDQDKRHYYFQPAAGRKDIQTVAHIGSIMELQNELHPRKCVVFEKQKPVKQLDYRFDKGEGKDKQVKELRIRDLTVGDTECGVKQLSGNLTLETLLGFVRNARCGKTAGEASADVPEGYVPVWMKGNGLKAGDGKGTGKAGPS